jgi:hypothetical protein
VRRDLLLLDRALGALGGTLEGFGGEALGDPAGLLALAEPLCQHAFTLAPGACLPCPGVNGIDPAAMGRDGSIATGPCGVVLVLGATDPQTALAGWRQLAAALHVLGHLAEFLALFGAHVAEHPLGHVAELLRLFLHPLGSLPFVRHLLEGAAETLHAPPAAGPAGLSLWRTFGSAGLFAALLLIGRAALAVRR